MFETKKKIKDRLIESFGNIKNDPFYFESTRYILIYGYHDSLLRCPDQDS